MVDIPLGQALVPVLMSKKKYCSKKCCFYWAKSEYANVCEVPVLCHAEQREDGKNVIFKLVDYPMKGEKKK